MDRTLDQRLKRLMLFRVVMVTTLLLIAAYVEAVSETLLWVNPLYFLIAATYALTLLHALALRFVPYREAQVYAQVVSDLVIITGLVYLTRSTGVGFMLLYPISVLSGSVLLYRRRGLVLAGLATILYAAMLWAVRVGMLRAPGLSEIPHLPIKHLLFSVFVTGVACATVAMIGSYFSESLRSAGERLEKAAGQVADLRELNEVIVNSIQSGLLTTDNTGRLLYVNRIGEEILGQDAVGLRGRNLRGIFGSPRLDEAVLSATVAHGPLRRFELVYSHPDGRDLDIGISLSTLATADAAHGGFLLVFQDLADIKRLEREVVVREKLAAVGEMAASLAHEIRNPLGSISGSAQVLMAEPGMSAEQGRLLAIITRESKRLSGTLNQFLHLARPGAQRLVPVDLGHLIGEAVALLRNGTEVTPHHRIEFELGPGAHLCLADADQILQVFWNLARNGIEAMPGGGLLRVHLHARGSEVVLSFRDDGRGMGGEEQRRVFEPFQSGTRMGVGLGLAIVYRIVKDHRGDIGIRSRPNQGTEVEVRLPLVAVSVSA